MKFHDTIRKHIKVLDSIQKIRTRDEKDSSLLLTFKKWIRDSQKLYSESSLNDVKKFIEEEYGGSSEAYQNLVDEWSRK